MVGIEVRPVKTKKDWDVFIDLAWKYNSDDPQWVPPLRIAVRDVLDVRKNPFFKHATMQALLAYQGDEPVGRIVGVIDEANNQFHKEAVAFWGFFECADDPKVADALFERLRTWAQGYGMSKLRGPMNPSTNHECGLLVEGFETPPSIMCTHNPRYYEKLIEGVGMSKAKDLHAYWVPAQLSGLSPKLLGQVERIKSKAGVTFRKINMRDFENEITRIMDIYNDAWEMNWGFVPMNEEEFRHMAKDMKMVIDPEFVFFMEVAGEPAGFTLSLPDANQVFKKIPSGRLFPTGIAKLLWGLKVKKDYNSVRIITLGIKKKYRPLGLGAMMYLESMQTAIRQKRAGGEASWILEDNVPMVGALLEHMNAKKTKVWRIYEAPLS
jgi:hypothetical protein